MGEKTVKQSIPAPSAGINATLPVDEMPLNYALELTNFIPKQKTESRDGFTIESQGLHSAIESLFAWNSNTGNLKLFGFADHKVFDASTDPATDMTGGLSITNDYWQGHQFRGQSVWVNGVDSCLKYTGASMTTALFSMSGSAYTATPPFIHIGAYKNRQFFVQKDTGVAWYGAVNQIDGTSQPLVDVDFSAFMPRGGYVMWAQSFTKSTGTVNQDFFVVCSSEGDILAYAGDYPGNTWALTAKWQIAAPLGRRSFVHVPGDLWVLTKQGIISIGMLASGSPEPEITAQIKAFWLEAVKYYGTAQGWEGVYYPKEGVTIINIPIYPWSVGTANYEQLIFADSEFSAANLIGLNGITHCVAGNEWYFGCQDGTIYKYGGTTNADGSNTRMFYQSPFSDFGIAGQQKHFTEVYALLSTKGNIAIDVEVAADYDTITLADPPLIPIADGIAWGDPWGTPWSSILKTDIRKFGVKAIGYTGSLKLAAQTASGKLYLNRCLLRFNVGGEN